jgi:ATP-dependent helicase/nuclease subunit B
MLGRDRFHSARCVCGTVRGRACAARRIWPRAREVPLESLVAATVRTLEALARTKTVFTTRYTTARRARCSALSCPVSSPAEVPLFLRPAEWPQAVQALVADLSVKPAPGGHPRISIWGTLEARLQTVDLMILGGLNEGVWPAQTQNDQFLTRGMKAGLGLEPPESRIGLAAHDFQMAMGQKRVILSRSERAEGAPSIASRWWQRLTTFAGEDPSNAMRAEGNRYLDYARAMEAGIDAKPAPRPKPAPPLAARPKSLSVTEVETLIRDPYAIYAKKGAAPAPGRGAGARSRRRRARLAVPCHLRACRHRKASIRSPRCAGQDVSRSPAGCSMRKACRRISAPSGGRASTLPPESSLGGGTGFFGQTALRRNRCRSDLRSGAPACA